MAMFREIETIQEELKEVEVKFSLCMVDLPLSIINCMFLKSQDVINLNITVIPLSIRTEKNNYFFLCPKTKENYFHTVRKFRESLMPIICQKVLIPKYTV